MLSQIIDTPQTLGIPLACFPKFKIGDLVQCTEDNSDYYSIGTITSILIYDTYTESELTVVTLPTRRNPSHPS